jgi:hypothetical protein
MHGTDFIKDLDVGNAGEIAAPRTLEVTIKNGAQIFPGGDGDQGANRLLIFTGTAIFEAGGKSIIVAHGVVRVRLQYRLPKTLIFKGSATVAALASIHGTDDEDSLFGADAAVTIPDPTDNGELDGGASRPRTVHHH